MRTRDRAAAPSSPVDRHDQAAVIIDDSNRRYRRMVARSLAWMYATAGLLAIVWVTLPHERGANGTAIVLVAVLALTSSSTRPCGPTPSTACERRTTCAERSTGASSGWPTSRSSTWTTAGPSRSRRSCGGSIPSAGRWRPTRSSPSPRRPG